MPRLCFGPFEIQTDSGSLRRDGVAIRLAPQPFLILSLLVRRGGELVTREEIKAAVWSDGTTVEFDQGLNYCIRQIRLALDDSGRSSRYIETVPKRGYRLAVPVTPAAQPGRAAGLSRSTEGAAYRWIAAAAAILLAAGLGLWSFGRAGSEPARPDPRTQELFSEAQVKAESWDAEQVAESAEAFREIIRRLPHFAPAHAELANVLVILGQLGASSVESLAEAEEVARRAIDLDPDSAMARAALGHCYWHKWMWMEAGAELHRAVVLGPDLAAAHQLYALYLVSLGRFRDATSEANRAVALDPESALMNFSLGRVSFQAGNYEGAIRAGQRTLELDADYPLAFPLLVRAYVMLGDVAMAGTILAEWESRGGDVTDWKIYWLARAGREAEARELATVRDRQNRDRVNGPTLGFAVAMAALGDLDRSFDSLRRSVEMHTQSAIWLYTTPELGRFRDDTRFADALFRMGLPAVSVAASRDRMSTIQPERAGSR